MPWVKIDEGMPDHEKVAPLSDKAFRSHIEAICYSARMLTDGRVTDGIARAKSWHRVADALVSAGLWEVTDGGWLIHDYLDFNPSREKVESDRAAARERMANARGNKGGTSPDVQPNFARSSRNPSPTPIPVSDSDPVPEPTVPDQNPPTPRKRGPQPVDEEFIASLVVEYAQTWPEAEVRERVEGALNHTASRKWIDKRRGVRDWLRRDASQTPRAPTPIRNTGTYLKPVPANAYEHLIHKGYE